MLKKIGFILVVVILLAMVAGIVGIRWFNNLWFKETPKHLTYTASAKPIAFEWSGGTYGDHFEPHYALLVPARFEDSKLKLYWQFDTGSPSTFVYENTIESLKESGIAINEFFKENEPFIENLAFSLGGCRVEMNTIPILENYGESFDSNDTTIAIKLGTIGTDFMADRITMIDFKNEIIKLYDERPEWMASLKKFKPFDFTGRRFMLPAVISGKKLDLFYDSGSSCFGLITSKNRYKKYTDRNIEEIKFDANKFGEAMPIHHKYSNKKIEIGNSDLELKRVSYVNVYGNFQRFLTPFTRIGGWLGNKPFTENTLILDTQKEEFIVIKSSFGEE